MALLKLLASQKTALDANGRVRPKIGELCAKVTLAMRELQEDSATTLLLTQ